MRYVTWPQKLIIGSLNFTMDIFAERFEIHLIFCISQERCFRAFREPNKLDHCYNRITTITIITNLYLIIRLVPDTNGLPVQMTFRTKVRSNAFSSAHERKFQCTVQSTGKIHISCGSSFLYTYE